MLENGTMCREDLLKKEIQSTTEFFIAPLRFSLLTVSVLAAYLAEIWPVRTVALSQP